MVYLFWEIRGKSHLWVKELHDEYGDVVRIGPRILAYRSSQAWKDIYGHRKKGQKLFLKDPSLYTPTPNGVDAIITADEANHTRVRRLLAHAFSRKALHEQETLLHTYADLLVQTLHEQAANASTQTVDINRWFNFTTFDLIGDLAFGEPFQCLQNKEYHWWVSLMFDAVRLSVYVKLLWYFPFLKLLLKLPLPSYLVERRRASFQLSVEKVNRRMRRQTDRPDFMSYILKHNDDKQGLSTGEIEANAATFVLAGSETTAALLSGCTYYLLRNPDTYDRLVNEIRGTFAQYSDICLSAIAEMPYLNAVLDESLRIYPPIPTMLPRLVPEGGAMIDGRFVPEGVSIHSGHGRHTMLIKRTDFGVDIPLVDLPHGRQFRRRGVLLPRALAGR
jgi:cytochrome P450